MTFKSVHMSSMTRAAIRFAVAFGLGAVAMPVCAHSGYDSPTQSAVNEETPKELKDIGIEEHLGANVDLGLVFNDEDGKPVTLGSLTASHKPVLLSLAYFGCPSLCNFHLNGLKDAFKDMKEPVGQEFEFVVVSIDPREKPDLAKQKREAYVKAYGRLDSIKGWHFWTGTQENIARLASQVGFKYRWDEGEKQWAHASAAYAITPEGRISRYFYGIIFDAKMLRLSLVEASNGTIGTIVDKLTLFCFHFDPKENKYTMAAFNIMRAGGGLTVLILAAVLVPFWLRSRRERRARSFHNGVQGEI